MSLKFISAVIIPTFQDTNSKKYLVIRILTGYSYNSSVLENFKFP